MTTELELATLECIRLLTESTEATRRCYDMERVAGLLTEKQDKHYRDILNRNRIELLVLKGELPEPTKPKPKYNEFGQRIKNNPKPKK